ncbi:MAG: hypothetical protein ABI581_03120 [Sediminibacterium sp.]
MEQVYVAGAGVITGNNKLVFYIKMLVITPTWLLTIAQKLSASR